MNAHSATLSALVVACACLGCDEAAKSDSDTRVAHELPDGGICDDETLYRDDDGDGFGAGEVVRERCLPDGVEVDGFARTGDDCAPDDPAVAPGADEVCGDHLDDNCDDSDEECPESMEAGIDVPDWGCASLPAPPGVYAWASFDEVNPYYEPGACFFFFEGLPGEFYVKPVNLVPTPERARSGPNGECEAVEGCICPSIENWSYDRGRLYAMTLRGEPGECAGIVVTSHAGDLQVVSNDCRKFLYQIWFNPNEYSFVAGSEAALRRRLETFSSVEIACFEGQPFDDLPFASLLATPVVFNDSYEPR